MPFTAHIRNTDKTVQTVGEHCRNTAVLAERYFENIGLGNVGRLVGLLHISGITDGENIDNLIYSGEIILK